MLTEKYDFRITDQMTIPLRPHWIANDSYREKCKMLVLNRSKGEIHKVDGLKQTVNHQNGWLRNTHVPHTENGGQQEKPRYVAS